MALQWSMVYEDYSMHDEIEAWLQKGFEPFAVSGGRIYMKRQFWNEEAEPKSSTKPENFNRAGNEPDEEDRVRDKAAKRSSNRDRSK